MKKLIAISLFLFSTLALYGQQPQVTEPGPQALQGINGKWVNGVAPGYYPTCSPATCASTLTLAIGPGTCFDSSGARHTYAGGTLTMTGSATNYVYLATSNCALTQNTTGYPTTGIMPVTTVTATTTITAIVDDRTWFGGAGGTGGGGGGGSAIKECIVTTGDPGAASPVLADDNDSPAQCGNDFGADITITAVACWADAGTPTVTPILTGGTGTSVLSGALTCGTATWAAGTVNGTPTIHAFSSNGATCSSTPCTLDSNITTAGGVAKYIVVKYTGTTTGGATTPISMGTASNHDALYDNAGSVGGITPSTAGQSITSVGAGSTPAFRGCHLSNGVNSQSASYTLVAADNGSLVTVNASSATATLPNPAPSNTWCAVVMNLSSSTNLTVSRNSLTINTGTTNLTLLPYQSATVWTDGSNYFSTLPLTGVTTTTASQTPNTTNINGAAVPISAAELGSNSSAQLVAATGHAPAVLLNCPDSSGSGTTQVCNTSPTFTPAGGTGGPNDCIWYTTTTTNSGTSLFINVNSLGAKAVAIAGASGWTSTLTASIIPADKPILACYDGTAWDLMQTGTAASGGGGGGGTVNTGGPNQITYYAASGTVVSGLITPLNVDIPPATPNAMDDEFNGSTLNTSTLWTATNIGSSTATEGSGIVSLGSITTNNAFSLKSYLQNVPVSTPWTITTKFAFNSTINGCNKYAGLVLSDGTKYEILEIGDLNTTTPEMGVQLYATATTGPTNLTHYDRIASFNTWIYLQVQNDGTNLNYTTSVDGITFIKLYSEAKGANFATAPTKIGIGGDASQTVCVQSAEYDWFRRTQ